MLSFLASYFPYTGGEIKDAFDELKGRTQPDLVLTGIEIVNGTAIADVIGLDQATFDELTQIDGLAGIDILVLAASNTPASFEFAAEQGFNVMTIGYNKPISATAALTRIYRDAWTAAGHTTPRVARQLRDRGITVGRAPPSAVLSFLKHWQRRAIG